MEKEIRLLLTLLCCALLTACGLQHSSSANGGATGDTIPLRYARNLTLIRHADCVEAILRNPDDTTQELRRMQIRQPMRRAAVFASVHCELLQELGVADHVAGIADLQYSHLPWVQQGVADGSIADFGNAMEPNVERIIDLEPDVIMPSLLDANYSRLKQLGIPVVECADYMEPTPLGRAEWVKLYGILFGVEERADSLFCAVEQAYLSLRQWAAKTHYRPTLLAEQPYQGIWYVPGGQSTTGILYHDAGAQYIFADRPESGGVPMSQEAVVEAGSQADIWLLKYHSAAPLTLQQMCADHPIYTSFRSFREGHVFGCNTAKVNFFEETAFHPERLLAALIEVFHPELGVKAEKQYFHPLE